MSHRPMSAGTPQWFGAFGRDVRCDDVLGDIAVGRRQVPAVFGHDALDRSRLSQLIQLRAAQARVAEAAGAVLQGELHHPIGADVRKRIDQDAVDDAEHRARGANPEREREDGGQRESWTTAQLARRIAEIGDDRGS